MADPRGILPCGRGGGAAVERYSLGAGPQSTPVAEPL